MHILVIPSWYAVPQNLGRGSFFHDQASALQRAGHQVGLLIPPSRTLTWHGLRELGRHWRQIGAEVHVGDDHGMAAYRLYWWGLWPSMWPPARQRLGLQVFDRYCREQGRPDVIHAHGNLCAGYLAAYIKQQRAVPFVLTEHASIYIRRLLLPGQRSMARYSLEHADQRLAVSTALADALRAYILDTDVQVISNGVDTAFFAPGDRPLPPSPFVFALIAHLDANKGLEVLLHAFQMAFSREDVRLKIGGGGRQAADLKKLARRLDIDSQVEFLGRLTRPQVRDLIQTSHAVISSSLVETFGITLIEATACGKPVIATRSGGPEDFVDETNGLLVPPGDPGALAAAMVDLRAHYARYDPAAIRAACAARFGMEEALVPQLEAVYRRVVQCSAQGRS